MKRTALWLSLALLWTASAGAEEVVRSFRQQIPAEGLEKISIDFPVGEVTVEAWDGSQVDLDVKLACNHSITRRCADAAKAVRLVYDNSGDRLRVEVKDWPRFSTKGLHVLAHISVPRDLPLSTHLGVGELTVEGTASDLDVDLGVGEVNITLPKEAIRSVDLDTGIGEATLRAAGRHYESAGLFTRELRWDQGTGRAGVTVDCGVGEIDVTLR